MGSCKAYTLFVVFSATFFLYFFINHFSVFALTFVQLFHIERGGARMRDTESAEDLVGVANDMEAEAGQKTPNGLIPKLSDLLKSFLYQE